jgi:hypothetical protein
VSAPPGRQRGPAPSTGASPTRCDAAAKQNVTVDDTPISRTIQRRTPTNSRLDLSRLERGPADEPAGAVRRGGSAGQAASLSPQQGNADGPVPTHIRFRYGGPLDGESPDQHRARMAWNVHALYSTQRHRGAPAEQAATSAGVTWALDGLYHPYDPAAPIGSPEFASYIRRTLHLARLATDTVPGWTPIADVAPARNERPASSSTLPTGHAPDLDLWTAATMNVPAILDAATRRLGLPSPSEHDLSLAVRLRQLDWTPQQIADVLLWNRLRRGENPKHPRYYTRTVDKAVQFVSQRRNAR